MDEMDFNLTSEQSTSILIEGVPQPIKGLFDKTTIEWDSDQDAQVRSKTAKLTLPLEVYNSNLDLLKTKKLTINGVIYKWKEAGEEEGSLFLRKFNG